VAALAQRGRPVRLDLPCVTDPGAAGAALDVVLAAVAAGVLTPEEAEPLGRFIAHRVAVLDVADLAVRIEALEASGE